MQLKIKETCFHIQYCFSSIKINIIFIISTLLKDPIRWPGISICRSPNFKSISAFEKLNKIKLVETTSEIEYNESIDQTYYTDPNDFILAASIGKTYRDAIKSDEIIKRIPVGPPYITTTMIDYAFNGYCASISFTELLDFLVKKGELDFKNPKEDTTFFTVFWLKVII